MAVWSHGVYSIDFYQPEKFSPNEAFKIDETRRVSSIHLILIFMVTENDLFMLLSI